MKLNDLLKNVWEFLKMIKLKRHNCEGKSVWGSEPQPLPIVPEPARDLRSPAEHRAGQGEGRPELGIVWNPKAKPLPRVGFVHTNVSNP